MQRGRFFMPEEGGQANNRQDPELQRRLARMQEYQEYVEHGLRNALAALLLAAGTAFLFVTGLTNANSSSMYTYFIIGTIIAVVLLVLIIRQVNQYERGVMLTLGKFTGIKEPGWRLVIPIFQRMIKVDLRVKAVDVPDQKVITKDNVSASINAVIYYKVSDAARAVLEVEDFRYAISQLAQTTMRNIVGSAELDEVLAEREHLSTRIREIIDAESDAWGLKVENVELKDFFLPEDMERTIAKQAEAEREKRSVIIKAEGEVIAAENMGKAAEILAAHQGALHLRSLQTLNDLSSDQSNTVIFAVPLEVLRAFERMGVNTVETKQQ